MSTYSSKWGRIRVPGFLAGSSQSWKNSWGRRVQVVTERGLDELLRERVLEEAVPL